MSTTSALTKTGKRRWHREEVKAEIRKRCGSLGAFALEHELDESAIGIALSRPWPRVERLIARLLRVRPQEIWPDRYTRDGRSRRRPPGRPPTKGRRSHGK